MPNNHSSSTLFFMYLSKLNLRSPIRSSVRKSNSAGIKSTNYQVKLQATFRAALFLLPFLFKMKGETQYPITSCVDNTCTKQCILLQISFHAYVKTPTSCAGPAQHLPDSLRGNVEPVTFCHSLHFFFFA